MIKSYVRHHKMRLLLQAGGIAERHLSCQDALLCGFTMRSAATLALALLMR